jgi:BlaI family transcriptional regulator, penicillinase repressor
MTMARTPQDVTDAELAILRVLWDRGAAAVRQLTDVLYPEGTTSRYATLQKVKERNVCHWDSRRRPASP